MYTLKSKRTETSFVTKSSEAFKAVTSAVIEEAYYENETDTIGITIQGEKMTVVVMGDEYILIDGDYYSLYDATESIFMRIC